MSLKINDTRCWDIPTEKLHLDSYLIGSAMMALVFVVV